MSKKAEITLSFQDKALRLCEVGIALTSIFDMEKLLQMILNEARKFTSAEAGSIYLVEKNGLRFKVTQNDILDPQKTSFPNAILPISKESIAGYVALTGEILFIDDVYQLKEDTPYKFNKKFDLENNYRTKSMLVVPMIKPASKKIIGVLQLINAKNNGDIVPFPREEEIFIKSLASQAAVAINNARLTEKLKEYHYETIFRLSVAAEYKDKETSTHLYKIKGYCRFLAEKLGLDKETVELIEISSTMHDIGKIGIPDAILNKPGRLTPEERKIIESHTIIGAKILEGSESPVIQYSEIVALNHHEKFDGTGYPYGKKGEQIPLPGRIIALADVFDALSSKRCYKPAMPMEKVVNIIKEGRGTHFDPEITDIFLDNLEEILKIKQLVEANPVEI